MSVIVLCIDQLPTSLLGVYGNTLFSTPGFDDFANSSFLLEHAFIRTPGKSWLDGMTTTAAGLKTFERLKKAGWRSTWITGLQNDVPTDQQCNPALEDVFDELWSPEATPAEQSVEDWMDSGLALHFSQIMSGLQQEYDTQSNRFTWIDLPFLSLPWDAPLDWRRHLSGEEDPEILNGLIPPSGKRTGGWDPDELLLHHQACGAQVMLLDHCLELFMAWLSSQDWAEKTTVVLTAKGGYSLGESEVAGWAPNSVRIEQTHVPFLIRPAGQWPYGLRIPGVQQAEHWMDFLIQECVESTNQVKPAETTRLLQTTETSEEPPSELKCEGEFGRHLLKQSVQHFEWPRYTLFTARSLSDVAVQIRENVDSADPELGQPKHAASQEFRKPPELHRTVAVSLSSNQLAIRTNSWSFLKEINEEGHLFVRPDDRFEQNNAVSRKRALAEQFNHHCLSILGQFTELGSSQADLLLLLRSSIKSSGDPKSTQRPDPATATDHQATLAKPQPPVDCHDTFLKNLPFEFWENAR